jgi:hypothetical protein
MTRFKSTKRKTQTINTVFRKLNPFPASCKRVRSYPSAGPTAESCSKQAVIKRKDFYRFRLLKLGKEPVLVRFKHEKHYLLCCKPGVRGGAVG